MSSSRRIRIRRGAGRIARGSGVGSLWGRSRALSSDVSAIQSRVRLLRRVPDVENRWPRAVHRDERDRLGRALDAAPYRETPLAAIYRRAIAENAVVMEDYSPYVPSGMAPAAFLAAPVRRGELSKGCWRSRLRFMK